METIPRLFDMIRRARYCVAFTGAGVSALSGLPCFRDPGAGPAGESGRGIPEKTAAEIETMIREFFGPGADPGWEELFSIETFENDPALFYQKAGPLLYHDKEPSIVHRILADLENGGFVKAVITQNIDMLHQKAGSKRVIELHGSPAFHYCLRCAGIRLPFAEAAAVFRAARRAGTTAGLPLCPSCARPLKPAITLYGEPLPIEARRAAETEAQAADLMLILGTSLKVRPAAEIPRTVLRRGGRIVIVNRQDTVLDDNTALRFRELEEVFRG
ncbi:MAG: NAD-dependent deacetylase [Treponema sp.]|jgi:NAD-dependent deacetylase|nr:NAD-dependent deacetylase [Treponema sp.]